MATTSFNQQPATMSGSILAQLLAIPAYKMHHYQIRSQRFLDKTTLEVVAFRQELRKIWLNDYTQFERLAAANPTQKAIWHLSNGWVNVPTVIEATFVFSLPPFQLNAGTKATILSLPLGLFNPYGLLLDSNRKPVAICEYPRVN